MDMGRRAGVIMHISSLPGDHGIGDIGDSAHAFVDALADIDIGVWQFLPLASSQQAAATSFCACGRRTR